jgi:polyisoprenoid-binding protein YceI
LSGKATFTGTLALHGQKKAIAGTADLRPQDGKIHVDAHFPVRVSDFQIPKPTYLGVGVRDEVQINVSLTAVRAPELTARGQR